MGTFCIDQLHRSLFMDHLTFTFWNVRLAPFGVRLIGIAQHARSDAEALVSLPRFLPEADVVVDLLPGDLARGLDPQLDKAVEVLQQDVAAWKKSNPPPKVDIGADAGGSSPGSK